MISLARDALYDLPPEWLGYRWIREETVKRFCERHAQSSPLPRYETVHPEAVATHPLPCNISSADALPATRGWWGYAFRDVPARVSGETFVATLPRCTVAWYRDASRANDFYPAILAGRRALTMRELRFRPKHAEVLRRSRDARRLASATWVIERVYHNHSHWLTAHLPKLLLLRERGALAEVLLPAERTPVIDASLRLIGMDPETFPTFDGEQVLQVDALTVLGTDRFRPELLRLVPDACGLTDAPPGHRRIFVSRARASRRRLANEAEIWPLLAAAGFERVQMEELPFEAQVALMRDTHVLFAPHGAGLTNMLFCPAGSHIVEIADLSFPNPNFYALASALSHRYWLLAGEGLGDAHPLDKDLGVAPSAVRELLRRLPA